MDAFQETDDSRLVIKTNCVSISMAESSART